MAAIDNQMMNPQPQVGQSATPEIATQLGQILASLTTLSKESSENSMKIEMLTGKVERELGEFRQTIAEMGSNAATNDGETADAAAAAKAENDVDGMGVDEILGGNPEGETQEPATGENAEGGTPPAKTPEGQTPPAKKPAQTEPDGMGGAENTQANKPAHGSGGMDAEEKKKIKAMGAAGQYIINLDKKFMKLNKEHEAVKTQLDNERKANIVKDRMRHATTLAEYDMRRKTNDNMTLEERTKHWNEFKNPAGKIVDIQPLASLLPAYSPTTEEEVKQAMAVGAAGQYTAPTNLNMDSIQNLLGSSD